MTTPLKKRLVYSKSVLYAVHLLSTSAESAESAHKDKQDRETLSVLEYKAM